MEDEQDQEYKRQNTLSGRQYIYNEINSMPGFKAFPSEGNFVLIDASPLGKPSAEIMQHMIECGIFIRPMSGHNMPQGFIRITVGTPQQNRQFIEYLSCLCRRSARCPSLTRRRMSKNFILAHDTGTGGDKAVLIDLAGRVIHSAYQPYGLSYPRPDWVEQDPDELWHAVAATSRLVIQESGVDPAQILGVGISAQMFNTLPVDEHIRPLTPMLSWLDVRSVHQADRLMEGDIPARLFQYTGNIPTAKDVIPKILWLKEERPDIWQRTAYLFDCKEYLVYKLTGKVATDWVGASAYFLFDPYKKVWSQEACRLLGIDLEKLPPAYPCTQIIGEVTEEAAASPACCPAPRWLTAPAMSPPPNPAQAPTAPARPISVLALPLGSASPPTSSRTTPKSPSGG